MGGVGTRDTEPYIDIFILLYFKIFLFELFLFKIFHPVGLKYILRHWWSAWSFLLLLNIYTKYVGLRLVRVLNYFGS